MPARTATVIYVGDAASIVKASAEARSAVDKSASGISESHGKIRSSFKELATTVIGLGAGFGLVEGVKGAVEAFSELQTINKQTVTALKSTGGQAGITAKGIRDLGEATSQKTGIDHLAVQASENLLLTFRSVHNEVGKGNDIFDQATGAITDMATAMNHGALPSLSQLHNTTILVGKALQDPVKGMTSLRRVGVELTTQQQAQVKAMVASGNQMGAQKLILGELTKEFGGSAEAAGSTFAGSLSKAKNAGKELAETVGGAVAPVLGDVATAAAKFMQGIEDDTGAGGKLRDVFTGLVGAGRDVVSMVKDTVGWFGQNENAAIALGGAIVGLTTYLGTMRLAYIAGTICTNLFTAAEGAQTLATRALSVALDALPWVAVFAAAALLVTHWKEVEKVTIEVWTAVKTWIVGAAHDVENAVSTAWHSIESTTTNVWGSIKGSVVGTWDAIRNTAENVFGAVKGAISDAWNAIKSATSAVWDRIKGGLVAEWDDIKGAASDAWSAIHDHILNPIKNAISDVKGAINDFKGWLSGAWSDITSGVVSFGSNVLTGVKNAFFGAVNTVIDFVNEIIGAIDLIPGVNIGKLKHVGSGSTPSSGGKGSTQGTSTPGHQPGRATGGFIDRPMVMVGEEAPLHPEYVIATNPAYRERNLGLWQSAGHALGIPGFGIGGVLNSVGGAIGGAVNAVGNAAGSVGGVLGGLLSKGASFILNQLPGVGGLPGWLAGMGTAVLGDAAKFIKSKVGSFLSGLFGSGGSGGQSPAVFKALSSLGWNKIAIAGALGNASQESSIDSTRFEVPGDWSRGVGLWQWTPGTKLLNWAMAKGLPWQSVMTQAMKLTADIGAGGVAAMNAQKSPGAAATWLEQNFEHAGIISMGNRIAGANAAFAAGYRHGGVIGVPYGGARASGGPVRAGVAYTVGEHGRETFVPDRAGRIVPNGVPVININGDMHFTSARQAKAAVDRLSYRAALGI